MKNFRAFLLHVLIVHLIFLVFPVPSQGYSSNDSIIVTRQMPSFVSAGETIIIQITVSVDTGLEFPLRGFYFTDEIPGDLVIQTGLSTITLNGNDITGTIQELGGIGDIYPSAFPYRQILETPPDFAQNTPLIAGDELLINYHLVIPSTAPAGTTYTFPGYSWAGSVSDEPVNYIFGYEDPPDNTITVAVNPDRDGDGIPNDEDNCPDTANEDQADNYPPGGNGCGDACECHADCNGDQKVNLEDLQIIRQDFLRYDCELNTCNADFNYDNAVDLTDLSIIKLEYLRTDCPLCQ